MRVTLLLPAVLAAAALLAGCSGPIYVDGARPSVSHELPAEFRYDEHTYKQARRGPLAATVRMSLGAYWNIPYQENERRRDGTVCKEIYQIHAEVCLLPGWNRDFIKSPNIKLECHLYPPDRAHWTWWYGCSDAEWWRSHPYRSWRYGPPLKYLLRERELRSRPVIPEVWQPPGFTPHPGTYHQHHHLAPGIPAPVNPYPPVPMG